jgi:hypothetical protein
LPLAPDTRHLLDLRTRPMLDSTNPKIERLEAGDALETLIWRLNIARRTYQLRSHELQRPHSICAPAAQICH